MFDSFYHNVELVFWSEITKISQYIHEFVMHAIDLHDVTKHVNH